MTRTVNKGICASAVAVLLASMLGAPSGAFGDDPSFRGLGDLEGGIFFSEAWAVTADGLTVAGQGKQALGFEAFVWTEWSS